jgi:DNA-binding NarL/FixJ family response regulator
MARSPCAKRQRKSPAANGLKMRAAAKKPYSLTSREIEVLAWVACGKSAWEIGEILCIAKRTVDEHVHSAVGKIGVANRTHAVAVAIRDRIIDTDEIGAQRRR